MLVLFLVACCCLFVGMRCSWLLFVGVVVCCRCCSCLLSCLIVVVAVYGCRGSLACFMVRG